MADYVCQMLEYDEPAEWTVVTAFGLKSAAIEYADRCDARSGGELFSKPTSIQTVIVRDLVSLVEQRFEIEVEFVKDFHAKEVRQLAV